MLAKIKSGMLTYFFVMDSIFFRIKDYSKKTFLVAKLHLLLWGIFIIYESVIVGLVTGNFARIESYVIHYFLNISIFYIHAHFLEKMDFRNRRVDYILAICLLFGEMLVYILMLASLNHLFTIYNQANKYNLLGIDFNFIFRAIYRCLFFIIISTGWWALRRYLRERNKTVQLEKKSLHSLVEKEKLSADFVKAQNSYLRAQINPHFLFNTLNFLNSRIKKNDPEAGELIITISEMLRYSLDLDPNEQLVKLSSEVEQVENLINFFQIKEKFTLNIHFDYDEEVLRERIIPLSMLTLVENIFKHGVVDDQTFPAQISIRKTDDWVTIETINKTADQPRSQSLNTGLKNLEQRLINTYKDFCSFKIIETLTTFQVTIKFNTIKNNISTFTPNIMMS